MRARGHILLSILTMATVSSLPAAAQQGANPPAGKSDYDVLLSFDGGSDGGNPWGGVIIGSNGDIYGTASDGGASGDGAVFELTPSGTETILYSFQGGADGSNPEDDRLVFDGSGDLYGVTAGGDPNDYGTVFKLAANNTETVLYRFCPQPNCSDGAYPAGGVIADKKGNLYGTTTAGGVGTCTVNGGPGCGTIFKIAPDGSESVLYAFTGGSDGANPNASLLRDKAGNLFGTTIYGGAYGYGEVFELSKKGTIAIIYSFTGGTDGGNPLAYLIADSQGNFYSTAEIGGSDGVGVVFKVTPAGTESVLYSFTGGSDGGYPTAGLDADAKGNLFGTTYYGGYIGSGCSIGCGTVFKLAPDGTESVLHAFTGGSDGAHMYAGVAMKKHLLYGPTVNNGNGSGYGTVFGLKE